MLKGVRIMNNELTHYGIKGQKWGVRRYQKSDGSLTPEGEKRYGSKEELQSLRDNKKQVDAVKKGIEGVQNKRNEQAKKANAGKIKNDLENMSDDELRAIVNRLNMEERYSQVMQSRYVNDGRTKTDKILDYGGKALVVASTALSIAIKMKELQQK